MFIDHDLHIHSNLSGCAGALGITQTPENILKYAEKNRFNTICVTDHFWDGAVYGDAAEGEKTMAHIKSALPLPQTESVRFLFGCETDMDRSNTIGLAPEHYKDFDFIIIPTTHFHLTGHTILGTETMEERAALWCSRLDHVLEQNLPFHKVGIAHLTLTAIMSEGRHRDVLQYITDEEYIRLFRKAADRGCGIELNFDWRSASEEELAVQLRVYRIAKEEGCRFYLGSDAHYLAAFEGMYENFSRITDLLQLDDRHKFTVER